MMDINNGDQAIYLIDDMSKKLILSDHKEQICTLMVLLSVQLLETSFDYEKVTCDVIRL